MGSAIPQPDEPFERAISLNEEQQKAVDPPVGPLMIVAGPGTGKTRTMTQKIARLIETGVDVKYVLAVTFTNKAAKELKERLRAILGKSRSLPFVGTFHSLGYPILNRSMAESMLAIADEETRKVLVHDAMALNGVAKKRLAINDMMGWIVSAKQKMRSSKEPLNGLCPDDRLTRFVCSYETYEHLLRIQALVDFEALIFRTVGLLEKDPDLRDRYAGAFSDIFIDEHQDINAGQYRLR